MNDLQSEGEERQPSPWPPRLLVIAILILLTVAVVRHLPSGRVGTPVHPAAVRPAAVRPAAPPAGPGQTGPVQLAGLGSGAAGLLDHVDGVVRSASPPRGQALGRTGLRWVRRRWQSEGCSCPSARCPARLVYERLGVDAATMIPKDPAQPAVSNLSP